MEWIAYPARCDGVAGLERLLWVVAIRILTLIPGWDTCRTTLGYGMLVLV